MIALLIASNSPAIAVGLVVGLGLGYIVGAERYFDRGYQLGRRVAARDLPKLLSQPEARPQAPRPLPAAKRDHQEMTLVRLRRIARTPKPGRK